MDIEKIILYVLLLILSLGYLALYTIGKIESYYVDSIKIPAVVNNSGILTTFYLKILPGTGHVFLSLPPFFDKKSQVGFVIAKDAVCKLYHNCDNYDYLFYSNDVIYGEGFSATAGLSLLIMSFFEHLRNKSRYVNYPITGFMLPNGVIASVGGIKQKLHASLEEYTYLVAPDNDTNIIPAYTILDLEKIYFNEYPTINITVPQSYKQIIKNISLEICKNITNKTVLKLIEKGRYYSAASLCFRIKVKSNITTKANVTKLINELEKKLSRIECYTYECDELKYQILSRLKIAKSVNGSLKYWRYITAFGWYKFLKIADKIHRKDTCDIINNDYTLLTYIDDALPQNISCFEKREIMAKLFYSLIEYRNEHALNSIINLTKYYMSKNGFSITAYNYMEYAEDLYKLGDRDSAFYYALLSLEYAI